MFFLDRPEDQVVSVRLRTKDQTKVYRNKIFLYWKHLGEFNELLNQVLRFRITESTTN